MSSCVPCRPRCQPCIPDPCCTRHPRQKEDCWPIWAFLGDACHPGLCCETLPKVSYRPFIPQWERYGQPYGHGVHIYSEKNTKHVWKASRNNLVLWTANPCDNELQAGIKVVDVSYDL